MIRLCKFLFLSLAAVTVEGSARTSELRGRANSNVDAIKTYVPSLRSSHARGGGKAGSLEESLQERLLKSNGGMGMKKDGDDDDDDNSKDESDVIENASEKTLIEPSDEVCMDWGLPETQERAASALTDVECKTNSCKGGCCRIYNWLICDASNSFRNLPCVCNDLTEFSPAPTPLPTAAPTSLPPTISPTQAPSTANATAAPTTSFVVNVNNSATDSDYDIAEDSHVFISNLKDLIVDDSLEALIASPITTAPTTAPDSEALTTVPPVSAAQQSPRPMTQPPSLLVSHGPIQEWQQCEAGSQYQQAPSAQACTYAEDCPQSNHCCIRSFCICGDPEGLTSECVPSRFES